MVHVFAVVRGQVRGHHEYIDVWNALNDKAKLSCESEPGSPQDP